MDFNKVMITGMIVMFIIIIIMFMKIEKLSKKNNYEDATNTPTDSQLTAINNQISQIYNMDVEAIRNLGAISKSLLTGTNYHTTTPTTPGTLTIPADTTDFKGNISANNLQINSGGYVRNGAGIIWPNGDITVGSNANVRLQNNGAITSGSLATGSLTTGSITLSSRDLADRLTEIDNKINNLNSKIDTVTNNKEDRFPSGVTMYYPSAGAPGGYTNGGYYGGGWWLIKKN